MNYQQADEKLQGRCSQQRKLGSNTYLRRWGSDITVRLHATDILTYHKNGEITVNPGGWHTVTTRARMNEYLPAPWRVGSDSHISNYTLLYKRGWSNPVAVIDEALTIPASGELPACEMKKLERERTATRELRNQNARERRRQRYWITKARTKAPVAKWKMPTIEQIQQEQNITVRTAMITVFGLERFMTQIKATVLDEVRDYQLLSYPLNSWQSVRALKMVCPSTKTVYIHPVEPRCDTVSGALDWMFQTENYLARLQVEA